MSVCWAGCSNCFLFFPRVCLHLEEAKEGVVVNYRGAAQYRSLKPTVATEPLKELVSAEMCWKCQIHTRLSGKPGTVPVIPELVRIKSSKSFLAEFKTNQDYRRRCLKNKQKFSMKKYANSIYIDHVLNINIWGILGLNTGYKYFPVLIFFFKLGILCISVVVLEPAVQTRLVSKALKLPAFVSLVLGLRS